MREPTFVGIGAQKAGSSSLYNFLVSAGVAPGKKELHYFPRSNPSREGYLSAFGKRGQKEHYGEFTPDYLPSSSVMASLANFLEETKFIVVLRNPIDRFYSSANHGRGKGFISSHWNAEQILKAALSGRERNDWLSSLIFKGLYGGQVEAALRILGPERVFVGFFEEFTDSQLGPQLLQSLLGFLNLPAPAGRLRLPRANVSGRHLERARLEPLKRDPGVDGFLREIFTESDSLLRETLGRRLPWNL